MNLRGFGFVLSGTIVAAVVGCNGGGGTSGGGGSIAPVNSNPPAPTNSASMPALVRATFASVASNSRASKGDTDTVTFDKEVKVTAALDPTVDFVLPVKGDTFGLGATAAS